MHKGKSQHLTSYEIVCKKCSEVIGHANVKPKSGFTAICVACDDVGDEVSIYDSFGCEKVAWDDVFIPEEDLEFIQFRTKDQGHVDVTGRGCRAIHKPTLNQVDCWEHAIYPANRKQALRRLKKLLWEKQNGESS